MAMQENIHLDLGVDASEMDLSNVSGISRPVSVLKRASPSRSSDCPPCTSPMYGGCMPYYPCMNDDTDEARKRVRAIGKLNSGIKTNK